MKSAEHLAISKKLEISVRSDKQTNERLTELTAASSSSQEVRRLQETSGGHVESALRTFPDVTLLAAFTFPAEDAGRVFADDAVSAHG